MHWFDNYARDRERWEAASLKADVASYIGIGFWITGGVLMTGAALGVMPWDYLGVTALMVGAIVFTLPAIATHNRAGVEAKAWTEYLTGGWDD